MKLEIETDRLKINAYEYRDKEELIEVVIPDSVEMIREGAFKNCRNIRKIIVGKGVKQVQPFAFDGIGKNLDIIWLSSIAYKSPLFKILPSFDDIDSLCAPKRFFSKAGMAEKRALVCGYILHPEYEQEYSKEIKEEYEIYIKGQFLEHFNELSDRGMIMEIFRASYERNLISENEQVKQFISYIKSRQMTKEEKEYIEVIEEKENLSVQEEDIETKKLRRYIREHISEKEMQTILEKEELFDLPTVLYKDFSNKMMMEAPVEALKFILTSYISQWTYMDARPSAIHACEEADYVASLLDEGCLREILEKLVSDTGVKYPRRIIVFLRYADNRQLEQYIAVSEEWKNYDIYGEEGILAKVTFEQAILMNDSEVALLHAYRNNRLSEYAFLRKVKVEDLFIQIVKILEKNDLLEELQLFYEKYIRKLYINYLSGSKLRKDDWYRWNIAHSSIRKIAQTLVWQDSGKKDSYFIVLSDEAENIAMVNDKMEEVCLTEDAEICLAHPVYMKTEQIRGFLKILKEKKMEQCFNQLKYINERLNLGDWELWNRRYYKMELPYERLQQLAEIGFQLDGRLSDRIRVSYYGKVLMEAFPTEKSGIMRLGYLLGSNYNMREINESVALMDDVFCYEMILFGRIEAAPYLKRFSTEQIEELLAASIELKHNENVAVLLEYKSKQGNDDDLSLNWE